ncbi:hypothetical protein [Ruania halotolerans]|uniref:hypothetical protein n=1 Tax=Ruania halotolerans TaxID=2897773 RepID=UPI001E3DE37C|nr:hypothetical protein [Ruania halotolerans]UFU05354.1 hypothetical protein LQF10_12950 [Ruania halotolerans]
MMNQHTTTTRIAAGLIAALALTSCSSGLGGGSDSEGGWTESSAAAESGVSPLLFLGDSVAAGQALPLSQAMAESGAYFINETSTGGGNVVGPDAASQWEDLPERLAEADGGTVVYQITSYDWGTPKEQEQAYQRLATAAADAGADLIVVSMPPIEPDEFYADHMDELATAAERAADVAADDEGVEFLDATEVWGEQYSREQDGQVHRSSDGIHTCPQGAAHFTSWLLEELAGLYPGFEPADADEWANAGWSSDETFTGC